MFFCVICAAYVKLSSRFPRTVCPRVPTRENENGGDRAKIAMRVSAAGEERDGGRRRANIARTRREAFSRKIGYESKIEGKIGLREVAGKKEILQSSSRRARRG